MFQRYLISQVELEGGNERKKAVLLPPCYSELPRAAQPRFHPFWVCDQKDT